MLIKILFPFCLNEKDWQHKCKNYGLLEYKGKWFKRSWIKWISSVMKTGIELREIKLVLFIILLFYFIMFLKSLGGLQVF